MLRIGLVDQGLKVNDVNIIPIPRLSPVSLTTCRSRPAGREEFVSKRGIMYGARSRHRLLPAREVG